MIYYIVLFDVMSVDMFMGYTDNEFIVQEVQKNDDLNNYIVYELNCHPDELENEMLMNFSVTLDKEGHKLKVYQSKDRTEYLISSDIQLAEVIYETDCYETEILRVIKAFSKFRDVCCKFIKDKEVIKFVTYMYVNYVCPDLFKFHGANTDQLSIDKIKLLAQNGYIGTIKSWR